MNIFDVFLIGVGLSMDAAAVSMTNSMVYAKQKDKLNLMPLFFGGFQFLMTLLGCFAGGVFGSFVEKYAGIIAFLILGIIGINMIREARCVGDSCPVPVLTYKTLFFQAIATAIDAFAVGVSFGLGETHFNLVFAAVLIGITTFLCTILAIFLGKKFGEKLGSKAEIFGGIILIIIGIKSLLGI